MRRLLALVTLAAVPVLAPAAHAASYSAAAMLSVAPSAQFDVADSPTISADGRYAVFRGSVSGQFGLWRRDLVTGQLDPVAVDLPGVPAANDPQAPSLSADGRYVAFTTQAQLDPVNDTNSDWDVYVRDMNVAIGSPGAYRLVSAVNGGTQGLSYGVNIPGLDGAHTAGWAAQVGQGLTAGSGGAISGDGTKVVFSIDTASNLVDSTQVNTPADQVAIRDLTNDTTQIVSIQGPPQAGAPPSCAPAGSPAVCWINPLSFAPAGAVLGDDAVISGDGSTVAWISPLGAIAQESAYLSGEENLEGTNGQNGIGDPQAVWRRLSGGPTLRVTGAVDPAAPSCPPGSAIVNVSVPAGCAGPLDVTLYGATYSHLALSDDGYSVVLLTPAPLAGHDNGGQQEAYLVDMHPGLTRTQATRALTQAVLHGVGEAPVISDAISGDGSTVLLATARSSFDLASPRYVGPLRTAPASGNELYAVNLAQDTIDLVTTGYDGSPAVYPATCLSRGLSGGGTESPALSADGSLIVFDSCADNLVWGDGNGASDVFAETALAAVPVSPATQQPGFVPVVMPPLVWRLDITTRSLPGGVELDVVVPGAGRLTAAAAARITRIARSGRRDVMQTVASSGVRVITGGLVKLRLSLTGRYRRLATRGLSVRVRLTFRPVHGRSLSTVVPVTFAARPARHGKRRR